MPVTVKLRNLRIAPRKVRLVADLIRGKSAEEAQTILNFTTKKAAGIVAKLLKSAVASAKHNFQLEESNLFISKIIVDEGQKYKRWMARARGQAYEIQKKTSHITIVLNEIVKKPKKLKKIKETKKVEKPKPAPQAEKPGEIPVGETAEEPQKEEKPPTGQVKPRLEKEKPKPKITRGIRRIFQRRGF